MLKQFVILLFVLLFTSFSFAYPELLTKHCASCHTEASGFGILTVDGKSHDNYFQIKTPTWLLLGVKADLNQTFTKTPYEKTGSFKATRFEGQLGLTHAIDTYLNFQAQGSLNRVEPKTKSDSISDYLYSPYRFIEVNYNDLNASTLSLKYGYYRNEWQNDLAAFAQSFKQSELIYQKANHQVNLGYQTKNKIYNSIADHDASFITYKYFAENRLNLVVGHQQAKNEQLSSLAFVVPKNENLAFKTLLAQTLNSGIKGFKGRFMPIYQQNSFLKFYGFTEYINTNIETAKPRTIVYGIGGDYLWFSQGLLSIIYSKTDDSVVINNPTEKLELNFHLYM